MWYLSPRLIALAFFDDAVGADEKKEMKKAYLTAQRSGRTNSIVPNRAVKITMSDTLASFVTVDTKEFFEVMKISTEFMHRNERDWEQEESYKEGKIRSASLQVTNDVAERGVKLISDINNRTTRDPTQQAYLLQVVESHRKRYPKKW